MFTVMECQNCHEHIKVSFLKGFAHIKCTKCGSEYQLDPSCLKIYMFIPFIAVGASIWFRITFINTEDIFIKTVVILFGSYLLYFLICILMIKRKQFYYCKKTGG